MTMAESGEPASWEEDDISQQPTVPQDSITQFSFAIPETPLPPALKEPGKAFRKKRVLLTVAGGLALLIAAVLYFTWTGAPNAAGDTLQVTPQNFSSTSKVTSASSQTGNSTDSSTGGSTSSGSIQAYIVGAVKHPGVYTLEASARIYQLLKAAGGPLPKANLVMINLAAPLKDGEEVYIPVIGETIPAAVASGNIGGGGTTSSTNTTSSSTNGTTNSTTTGGLVNINTASADEMRQQLHVSSKTAQAIISYRLQHGAYTSVSDLTNVISTAIYKRIKDMVTV